MSQPSRKIEIIKSPFAPIALHYDLDYLLQIEINPIINQQTTASANSSMIPPPAWFREFKSDLELFFQSGIKIQKLPPLLQHWTPEQKSVYDKLSLSKFGQKLCYSDLHRSARFAGTCMKKNLFPILIPCHRVIKKNGELGEFNARGGKQMKEKLLHWENSIYLSIIGKGKVNIEYSIANLSI